MISTTRDVPLFIAVLGLYYLGSKTTGIMPFL